MHKHRSIIVIISTALLVIGVAVSSFLTQYSSTISSVVTTITAIIGAVALYIQFKKDKEIDQASFMIEFHESFYSIDGNSEILNILDEQANGNFKDDLTDKKYYKSIMGYLGWIRTLCSLIENDVLEIKKIDEIFSYKFFALTNNKQVQDVELVTNSKYYEIVYRVHQKWMDYKRKNNKSIVFENTSLDKALCYQQMLLSKKQNKKQTFAGLILLTK